MQFILKQSDGSAVVSVDHFNNQALAGPDELIGTSDILPENYQIKADSNAWNPNENPGDVTVEGFNKFSDSVKSLLMAS